MVWHIKKIKILVLFSVLMIYANYSEAQKRIRNDYILYQDSLHFDGKILDISTKEITTFVFKRIKDGQEATYGVGNVSEFLYKDRLFFRKNIGNQPEILVFLELIPTENKEFDLYRLNGKKEAFFLENKNTDQLYAITGQDSEAFSSLRNSSEVIPLINLTKQNTGSLAYLLNSAGQIKKTRTFSNHIYVEPFFATGVAIADFQLDLIEINTSMSGMSMSGGMSLEAFINFKRNISFSLSPQMFGFNATKFERFTLPNGQIYETDLSISLIGLQFPLAVKYYLDISPQKFRSYIEMGYSFSNTLNQKSFGFGAWQKNNEITFHSNQPVLADSYQGVQFGLGTNFIQKNEKILTLGLKGYLQSGNIGNTKLNMFLISLGLKF